MKTGQFIGSMMMTLMSMGGCAAPDTWDEGPGDARITADAWGWGCDDNGVQWVGTQHFFIDVQYAPEEVWNRPLPAPGECASWTSMFAVDDLLPGTAFEDEDYIVRWSLVNGEVADRASSGALQPVAQGYWAGDAYDEFQTCYALESVMMDGVLIKNAPELDGVSTPLPGMIMSLQLDVPSHDGLPYGTEFTAEWEADGWQEQFIMLHRTRGGVGVETIVCNTAGQDSFSVDASFWALSDSALGVDTARFFVGFRNWTHPYSDTGLKVEALSRGMWSVSVNP